MGERRDRDRDRDREREGKRNGGDKRLRSRARESDRGRIVVKNVVFWGKSLSKFCFPHVTISFSA